MNLFRSEEHAARWVGRRGPGATIPVVTLGELARAWYADRLDADWTPRSREQSQAILDGVGLTDAFWLLTG
jgi:hypothetical protein